MDIPIDSNVTPVMQPYRRVPIPLENKVRQKIFELLENDVIEPVSGPSRWVSPLVIIPKGDDIRLCVDMRRANEAIIRENYPIPTMDNLLPYLKKSTIFTKLDIRQAFHQLEIEESSRHITTFISNVGLFRYKRLMFGISCAPEIFQRVMERILSSCEGCIVYIDDILIFGETNTEHDIRVKNVLKCLQEAGVELNEEKNEYAKSEVTFLGHVISKHGVKPTEDKITDISNFRRPNNVDELRSFLGLINYIGRFIPNLSSVAEPLYFLLRKENTFLWESKQEEAFQSLKNSIRKAKYLSYFDVNEETYVVADASPVGLGAVLLQGKSDHKKIIAFASKTLTSVEKRYSQTEKEALSLVWAVEKFHMYLFGKEFTLATDHKPLEFIFSSRSKPCARIERWVLRLQTYKFKVMYIPGKTNIADSFSRLQVNTLHPGNFDEEIESQVCEIVEFSMPNPISHNTLRKESENDTEINRVIKSLQDDSWPKDLLSFKIIKNELCVANGILLRGARIVIPSSLRPDVLALAHEGHPGMTSMKTRLRRKVWWPRMDLNVEQTVKGCRGCQMMTIFPNPEPMKRRNLPNNPWEDLAIDFLGPLPSGDYLFVVVDYYSRFFEIEIMKKIDSKAAIDFLKTIFARFGIPRSITADNGSQFISTEFENFCLNRGIRLFNTTPYWPQENGEVEIQNKSILKRIRISQNLNRKWKEDLLDFLLMYRSTPHSVVHKTPSELLFGGRTIRDKLPQFSEDQLFDEDLRETDALSKEKGKEYADNRRNAKTSNITVGDTVLLKNQHKINKLTPNFNIAEHTVIGKNGSEVTVKNNETGVESTRNSSHVKKIPAKSHVITGEDLLKEKNEKRPERKRTSPSKFKDFIK